jgi:hypothetical protein
VSWIKKRKIAAACGCFDFTGVNRIARFQHNAARQGLVPDRRDRHTQRAVTVRQWRTASAYFMPERRFRRILIPGGPPLGQAASPYTPSRPLM